MRRSSCVILVILVVAFSAGCSVKYKAIGSFDDYNEVFVGDVDHNILAGTGRIVAETKNSKIKCEGDSVVTYIPPMALGCELWATVAASCIAPMLWPSSWAKVAGVQKYVRLPTCCEPSETAAKPADA